MEQGKKCDEDSVTEKYIRPGNGKLPTLSQLFWPLKSPS